LSDPSHPTVEAPGLEAPESCFALGYHSGALERLGLIKRVQQTTHTSPTENASRDPFQVEGASYL